MILLLYYIFLNELCFFFKLHCYILLVIHLLSSTQPLRNRKNNTVVYTFVFIMMCNGLLLMMIVIGQWALIKEMKNRIFKNHSVHTYYIPSSPKRGYDERLWHDKEFASFFFRSSEIAWFDRSIYNIKHHKAYTSFDVMF